MLLKEKLKNKTIILASASPRRQHLLKEMGIDFKVQVRETDETFPASMQAEEIALFLCRKKAEAFRAEDLQNTILITADTIVWLDNETLDKPADKEDALNILRKLSGRKHEVITGVCLKSYEQVSSFHVSTKVCFKELKDEEIMYYIEFYKPFDKAGGYGIQEWIGYTGICGIEGSYYNVMGLPTERLYDELMAF